MPKQLYIPLPDGREPRRPESAPAAFTLQQPTT